MKKLLLENLSLKIASVLLAIVMWIFVTSRGQSEMSIEAPLEFKNVPQGLELVNYSIKTVSMNIKGQERFIKNVKPSDVRPFVDLAKARKGESIHYISREDIKAPPSITVTNINPSSVRVYMEETISRTVKVTPVLSGEAAPGYYVRAIEISPQNVVIEGVKSEIIKIGAVRTEPFDITGMNETFTQDLKIDLTGRNVRPNPNEVKIKVVIGARAR